MIWLFNARNSVLKHFHAKLNIVLYPMEIVDNLAIFSTGKEVMFQTRTIGMDPDQQVSESGDHKFHINKMDEESLTALEKIELAEFMINQWAYYKYLAENELTTP